MMAAFHSREKGVSARDARIFHGLERGAMDMPATGRVDSLLARVIGFPRLAEHVISRFLPALDGKLAVS